jgi:hypothetical protein
MDTSLSLKPYLYSPISGIFLAIAESLLTGLALYSS